MTSGREIVVVMRGGSFGVEDERPGPVTIHGLPAMRRLRRELSDAGFTVTTDMRVRADPAAIFWDFGSVAVLPRALRRFAPQRAIAWSLESPLVAHRGYHRLPQIAEMSAHVLGYPGVGGLVQDRRERFSEIRWPTEARAPSISPTPWEERRPVVMINSNKRAHHGLAASTLRRPYSSARVLAAAALARSYPLRGSWTVPDLYDERLRALTHFAFSENVDLFGVGWDGPIAGVNAEAADAIASRYRGRVADKHQVLGGYRFALCFENTIFPGYVTEKILDCFLSGVVPVYLGAPDITSYVPSDAFIDMRNFTGYPELEEFLRTLSSEDGAGYLSAADRFLDSDGFSEFDSARFVEKVLAAVGRVAL